MTYVNTEQMARAASTAQSAANDMCRAAGTAEEAARSLRCLFEEGYGSPALELLELLRNQDNNLSHENQQLRAELDALGKLLPGTKYMDLPDGGSPTIGEQITRMITDLQNQNTELLAQNYNMTGLVLRLRDRWWPFVHGAVGASKAAINLLNESAEVISKNPKQCLAKVKADAGRVGFIAGYESAWAEAFGISKPEFLSKYKADQYAEHIRQG